MINIALEWKGSNGRSKTKQSARIIERTSTGAVKRCKTEYEYDRTRPVRAKTHIRWPALRISHSQEISQLPL